jgi:hypothetical protein
MSACPISGHMIAETELICPTTKDDLPYCVVSGKHMTLEDWGMCPHSRMPALISAYAKYLETETGGGLGGRAGVGRSVGRSVGGVVACSV